MTDPKSLRLLVAVGPSPHSEYLVRRTMELARSFSASWVALHVDTGKVLPPDDIARVEDRLAQARALGGETSVVSDEDVASRIVAEARKRACDIIIIGRSGLSSLGLFPRRSTISDRVARSAGPADVLVVRDKVKRPPDHTLAGLRSLFDAGPRQYTLLGAAFSVLLGIGFPLSRLLGYRPVALVFLAAVICLSLVARPVPVAIFAMASATALNFFLIPPYFTLNISLVEDVILFAVYFLAAFVTSTLVASVRSNARLLKEKERKAAFLSESLEALSSCGSAEAAADRAAAIAAGHFGRGVISFIAGPAGEAVPAGTAGDPPDMGADGLAAAALITARAPGSGDDRHSGTGAFLFVPADVGGKRLGALGIERRPGWTKADTDLLLALGRALALSIDRQSGELAERNAAVALESERLSRILLDAVSHELRTPLTTVTGVLSALADTSLASSQAIRTALLVDALEAADRLNSVVDDLLSASRIGAGRLRLRVMPSELSEIAAAAKAAAAIETKGREVRILIEGEDSPVDVDLALVSRLAANLLKNAGRHSRPGTPIEVCLSKRDGILRIEVRDNGPGLPPGMVSKPFGKYAHAVKGGGGLGLGLSICEGIAAAHGGRLEVVENEPHRFRIAASIPVPEPKENDR